MERHVDSCPAEMRETIKANRRSETSWPELRVIGLGEHYTAIIVRRFPLSEKIASNTCMDVENLVDILLSYL